MTGSPTPAPFDPVSWHDCHIWGLDIVAGAPHENDWASDLVLDIDFVTGGREFEGTFEFSVVPASLAFHGVTGLGLGVEVGAAEAWTAVHPWSVDRIERERVREQKIFLDRAYYRWRIGLNWPAGGEITFGAYGFTQTPRGEAVWIRGGRQNLTRRERAAAEQAAVERDGAGE